MRSRAPMELFDSSVYVFGAPSRYVQGPHALDLLGRLASTLGHSAVLLIDKDVLPLVRPRIEASLVEEDLEFEVLSFSGELLQGAGERFAAQCCTLNPATTVVGVGGGRAIDGSKALAEHWNACLITVPTIASNDAPTSKNFVFYDHDHRLVEVRHLMRNPDYVLVDEGVVAGAPKQFLATGIGDAIAKKFEADACAAQTGTNMFGARPTLTAREIAKACYRELLANGVQALTVAGEGRVTPEFSATIEATILMAGLGFESGGLSLAHSMTRGLSMIEGVKSAPHGFQVAYALLVQLHLEGISPDPRLVQLYEVAGLPMTLAELAGRQVNKDEFTIIAEATMTAPYMKNFLPGTSASDISSAMQTLETEREIRAEVEE